VTRAVLIAGGGTGGHVFPMLAVGEALRAEAPDVAVVFAGTPRGMEATLLSGRAERLELLEILPLRGGGVRGFARGAWRALAVLPEARRLVRDVDPVVVFSVGGYAAGPVALAAWTLGVPVALLEPNAVAGLTNRLLARLARRAYVCFPETERTFGAGRSRWTGVPLRRRFAPARYGGGAGPVRVLVLGGSQGAAALNERVPAAVARSLASGAALSVVHQAGRDKDAAVRARYAALGIAGAAEVCAFIDDPWTALCASDVVIARAGASTTAEICAVGRASILVPYPFAADDHQRHNAASLARDGAAVCLVQSEASPERLAGELDRLSGDPAARVAMAERAAARGRPDAARTIALDLLALGRLRPLASREGSAEGSPGRRGEGPRPMGGDGRVRMADARTRESYP
jgi:UDP-N-acetylglucosamine--N-acetylmuramyl-(pentapeptide) pyrophosphoryl-undecaprenol N-acetylglucosamine transferase